MHCPKTTPCRAPHAVDSGKAALRRTIKQQIAALDAAYTAAASAAIARRLTAHPAWAAAGTVFCYVGTNAEIDTMPILRAALDAGKTLVVPRCTGPGVMEARVIQSPAQLAPRGRYGILEPGDDAPVLPPQRLELCVLPCLSAAPDGTRLGYGGGYYDRFLPQAPHAVKIALCRAALLQPALPQEAHDVRADFVLTEDAWYARGACIEMTEESR